MMAPKKKKSSKAAEHLIESLLGDDAASGAAVKKPNHQTFEISHASENTSHLGLVTNPQLNQALDLKGKKALDANENYRKSKEVVALSEDLMPAVTRIISADDIAKVSSREMTKDNSAQQSRPQGRVQSRVVSERADESKPSSSAPAPSRGAAQSVAAESDEMTDIFKPSHRIEFEKSKEKNANSNVSSDSGDTASSPSLMKTRIQLTQVQQQPEKNQSRPQGRNESRVESSGQRQVDDIPASNSLNRNMEDERTISLRDIRLSKSEGAGSSDSQNSNGDTNSMLGSLAEALENNSEFDDKTTPIPRMFDNGKTMAVNQSQVLQPTFGKSRDKESKISMTSTTEVVGRESVDRDAATVVRHGGKGPSFDMSQGRPIQGLQYTSTEAALKQSESFRVAQERINGLDLEVERLRRENEQLHAAGETLRRSNDEFLSRLESLEIDTREKSRTAEEEKKVLRGQLTFKERENLDFKRKNEEMETRLESNFKKVRVRERELEHRLEILKLENSSLIATKDKMLLELKRQIDQLSQENDYGKQRSQEVYSQFKEKQETVRRVVRALRIALTILEGDEANRSSGQSES
jgi:hypothetical protein